MGAVRRLHVSDQTGPDQADDAVSGYLQCTEQCYHDGTMTVWGSPGWVDMVLRTSNPDPATRKLMRLDGLVF
jgi:hypothetical protein